MTTNAQRARAENVACALSRAVYRRLAPHLSSDDPNIRQRVLDACETTMHRLEQEPDFARPDRFLFEAIRSYFPLGEQLRLRKALPVHLDLARRTLDRLAMDTPKCGSFTRSGEPCRREAVLESRFCPSHRHLDLMEEPADSDPPPA